MHIEDPSTLKLIRYKRKSTEPEDRQVASLTDQEHSLDQLAQQLKLKTSQIVEEIEESRSAKSSGTRPGFNNMLTMIRRGQVNAIMAWHADRLSRNLGDVTTLVDLLESGRLVAIITPQHVFGDTPMDKYMIATECLRAKLDNDNKSANIKRGLAGKIRSGWRPGPAPIGYLPDTNSQLGTRRIHIDPERFPLVRRAWDLLLSGKYLPSEIQQIANTEWKLRTRATRRQGGNPLTMAHLYKLFHNPFYYGSFWWKNPEAGVKELKVGKHQPMVTKREFDRVQEMLARGLKPRPQRRSFAYTGLITCGECGCAVTASHHRNALCTKCMRLFACQARPGCPKCNTPIGQMTNVRTYHYEYYHCTRSRNPQCSQKAVETKYLENQIVEQLRSIDIDSKHLQLALEYLKDRLIHFSKTRAPMIKSLTAANREVADRLTRLENEYTSPQNTDYALFSPSRFKERKRQLMQDGEKIKERIKEVEQGVPPSWLNPTVATFKFCAYARYHLLNGDLKTKRAILSGLASDLRLTNRQLTMTMYAPYLFVAQAVRHNGNDRMMETASASKSADSSGDLGDPGGSSADRHSRQHVPMEKTQLLSNTRALCSSSASDSSLSRQALRKTMENTKRPVITGKCDASDGSTVGWVRTVEAVRKWIEENIENVWVPVLEKPHTNGSEKDM